MRKPTICIGEKKATDQLCSNCTADQHFVFATKIVQSFFLNPKFFRDCTDQFVSDLVGNPEDWFSRFTAHIGKLLTSDIPFM